MIYDLYFCYRIEKEAGLGEDENGKPCEIYTRITLGKCNTESRDSELEKRTHIDGVRIIADMFNVNPQYIIPVSQEEYDANNDDDEDEGESVSIEYMFEEE